MAALLRLARGGRAGRWRELVPRSASVVSVRSASTNETDSAAKPTPPIGDVFSERTEASWKHGLAFGGGAAVLGGLAVLGYHHLEMPAALDAWAGLSVLAGVAAIGAASPRATQTPSIRQVVSMRGYLNTLGRAPHYSFTQLNSRSAAVAKSMDKVASAAKALPPSLQEKLAQADRTAAHEHEAAVKARAAEIEELATGLLDSGTNPASVRRQCFPRCFVVAFEDPSVRSRSRGRPGGPTTASAVAEFGGVVSMLVDVATEYDEVIVKMTSPGGGVAEYGQLAMQILRLRKAGITTTVCVDTVAASGGYMAACVADKVYAAPFAYVGSIGVVAEMPNVANLLKKNNVDWMLFTAGKWKRTVHPFAEVTDKDKEKFQDQLEDIHDAFADHVAEYRDDANSDDVSTGEAWLALHALQKGLVDDLLTSDEYVQSKLADSIVIDVKPVPPQPTLRDLLDRTVSAGEALFTSALGLLRGSTTSSVVPIVARSSTPDKFHL